MSRLSAGQLNVRKIDSLCDGVHGDGGNLYLTIKGQARHWTVRYFSPTTHKRREISIGSAYIITLAKARQLAIDIRRKVAVALILWNSKPEQNVKNKFPTLQKLLNGYIEEQQAGWKDPRSAPIWRSSLSRLAYPVFGDKIISSIDTDDILAVLKPIWTTKTERLIVCVVA